MDPVTQRRHRTTVLLLAAGALIGAVISAPGAGRTAGGSEAFAGLMGGIALLLAALLVRRFGWGAALPAGDADVPPAPEVVAPLVPAPSSRLLGAAVGLGATLGTGVLYALGRSVEGPLAVPLLLAAGIAFYLGLRWVSAALSGAR